MTHRAVGVIGVRLVLRVALWVWVLLLHCQTSTAAVLQAMFFGMQLSVGRLFGACTAGICWCLRVSVR